MTRNRLALLAAALVLIVISGVLVGTRLFNRPTSEIPSGHVTVADLLARPMHIEHRSTSASCPNGPFTNGNFGTGPVYGLGGGPQETAWGTYWYVYVQVDRGTPGPIVFRGQDVVLGWPLVFVSQYAVGPVYGTDTLTEGKSDQYTAVELEPAHEPKNWIWQFEQGFKHGWSGCVGFQADGPGFSETFYSAGAGG